MGVCGRVLESTQTTGGSSYTMAYAYDRAGNLTSQRYPSDRVVDYVYDGAGRIAGVKTGADGWYAGGTGANAVDYEAHGGLKQLLLGNGLWEQRRYNARLQPTQIGLGTTQATGGLTATGPRPTASLLLLDYSYGAGSNNGNVLSQRIRVGASLNQNQAYTYDALNRLKTAAESGSGTAWSQTYAYDRYGNRRVTAGASHGSNQALTPQSTADIAAGTNRLAGTKGVNLTVAYDAAGNLKADWAANAFKYDGDNRLVAFDKAMGTDSDTTYAYDGEGRRVQKVVGGSSGVTTTYVYNVLGQLVAEFGGTAPDRPGTRYLTPDPLGSTRLVTGEDQSVLSRHDYLPFGEEIGSGLGNRGQATGVSGYTASRTDGPAQKFTGKERDNESGLDYFGARYFSGAGGRFTSVDPYEINQEVARAESQDQREELLNGYIGNPQGWNRYSYVRNNPLAMIDPDGRDALWVVDKRTSQTTLRIPVKFVGAGATKQNVDTIVKRVHSLNLGGSPVRIEVIPTNKPINGVLNTMDFSPGLDMKNYPVGEGTTLGGNKAHIDSSVPSGTDAAAHDILHFAGIDDQYTEGPRDSSGNRTTTPRPGYNKTNIMTSRSGTNLKPRQIQEAYANRSTKDCTTEQDGRTTCR